MSRSPTGYRRGGGWGRREGGRSRLEPKSPEGVSVAAPDFSSARSSIAFVFVGKIPLCWRPAVAGAAAPRRPVGWQPSTRRHLTRKQQRKQHNEKREVAALNETIKPRVDQTRVVSVPPQTPQTLMDY